MVAMVGILPGQGFTSWGSNPKCRILWLLFFFFYVNVDVVWTKNLWCEQRARLGFHMLGMKPDCKIHTFLFLFQSWCWMDENSPMRAACQVRRERWNWYWQPRSSTRLVKNISIFLCFPILLYFKPVFDIDNRPGQRDLSKFSSWPNRNHHN